MAFLCGHRRAATTPSTFLCGFHACELCCSLTPHRRLGLYAPPQKVVDGNPLPLNMKAARRHFTAFLRLSRANRASKTLWVNTAHGYSAAIGYVPLVNSGRLHLRLAYRWFPQTASTWAATGQACAQKIIRPEWGASGDPHNKTSRRQRRT